MSQHKRKRTKRHNILKAQAKQQHKDKLIAHNLTQNHNYIKSRESK